MGWYSSEFPVFGDDLPDSVMGGWYDGTPVPASESQEIALSRIKIDQSCPQQW